MMMKRKLFNSNDTDTLNPMADVRNYGAGAEDGIQTGPKNKDDEGDDDKDAIYDDIETTGDYTEPEPLDDEIANPEEPDDEEVL
jgi:hypothetical protein